jgi:hypothetical protein
LSTPELGIVTIGRGHLLALTILIGPTPARLFRFQIQLVRPPKTAEKPRFSERRRPIYF